MSSLNNLEETLENIDVFCKVLSDKITQTIEDEDCSSEKVEQLEDLLRAKNSPEKPVPLHFSPLLLSIPQAEEPLIDVFENADHIKVLIQFGKKRNVKLRSDKNELEIWVNDRQKVGLQVKELDLTNMTTKYNDLVFEIDVPKIIATV